VSLFARSFLLIALLIVTAVLASFQIYRIYEREPRSRELAQQTVSTVNLVRAALVSADPYLRRQLLVELNDTEGLRVYPATASEKIEPLPDEPLLEEVEKRVREALGADTRFGADRDGEDGFWAGVGWVHDVTGSDESIQMLRIAILVDPGQALYHRELGATLLATGDPAASAQLETTLGLNPSDTAAWRLLSLSRSAAGDLAGAELAAAEAVTRERIEPANLLALAAATAAAGDTRSAKDLVGEALARAPWLIGDLAGPEVVPGVTTVEGIEAAIDVWLTATEEPPNIFQPAWLSGLSARSGSLRSQLLGQHQEA